MGCCRFLASLKIVGHKRVETLLNFFWGQRQGGEEWKKWEGPKLPSEAQECLRVGVRTLFVWSMGCCRFLASLKIVGHKRVETLLNFFWGQRQGGEEWKKWEGPKLPSEAQECLRVGVRTPITEHQKFWLQTTRETRTGTASEADVVLSALAPYWVSQYFYREYQMRVCF